MTLVQFSLIPVFSTGRGGCIEMPSDGYASTDRSMEWVHGRCIIFICYLLFFFFFLHSLLTLTEGYPAILIFFSFSTFLHLGLCFGFGPFFLLQIPTLHSFEKPQLEDIRHTYFFPSVFISSDYVRFL